jgi:hypothetical protein
MEAVAGSNPAGTTKCERSRIGIGMGLKILNLWVRVPPLVPIARVMERYTCLTQNQNSVGSNPTLGTK